MAPQRKIVVLVVDDESAVRDLLELVLTRAGYMVLTAGDGPEALAKARGHHGRIDLLLSDVKMPLMRGTELAAQLTQERPGIRVLLMSGHSSGPVPPEISEALLRKPFLPNDVLCRIAKALDDRTFTA
jgi:CheY-like chemotaxis protein